MEKITEIERYQSWLEKYQLDEDDKAFVNRKIEQLKNRAKKRKETKTPKQIENENLSDLIYRKMETLKRYTFTELKSIIPEISGLTPQKISGILENRLNNSSIKRERNNGISYFYKV